ncbi:MAG: S-layer homology domain-containing protein [Thermoleophilia bacterium]|nr:S-layer homology domain-containing protein [Thermoleophilia bacterium]
MTARRIIGGRIGRVAASAVAAFAVAAAAAALLTVALTGADPALAASSATITVTLPAGGAAYAAPPTGSYTFPDRSGAFAAALFEGSPDLTVGWTAAGVTGDVRVDIVMDGETIHSGTAAAAAGSYAWQPAAAYGQAYGRYADCRAVVSSVADPAVNGASATFAIIPWGAVVQEWNGLQVYSNFPRPNWTAPGVGGIPVFGDSGFGWRYQCVELAQRWTTQVQHWRDKDGKALPSHWAGLLAKEMLTTARSYGLTTVANDHTAVAPPAAGDLLVWGAGEYGHVAVVGGVEAYRLRIYEQNGANPLGTRTLELATESGGVWVDEDGVTGWIQPLPQPAATFTDVDTSPYRQAIEALAAAGIISGYPDGTFRPGNPVTRQQFTKIIVRTLSLPVSEADVCPFGDVPKDVDPQDPLYPDNYVAVCVAYGITTGMSPTRFAPYDNMTRAQLITMAVRAAHLPEPPVDYKPTFGDFSSDHYPWARKAACAGFLSGLEGMSAGYDFWAPASRGEVAQMIYGLLAGR